MRLLSLSVLLLLVISPFFSSNLAAKDNEDGLDGYKETPDRVAWEYAGCLVERKTKEVREIFLDLPRSSQSDAKLRKLQMPKCLTDVVVRGYNLKFQPALMRGFLAEHLLRRDFNGLLGKANGKTGKIYPEFDDPVNVSAGPTEADVSLISGVQCVVKNAPNKVSALFAATVSSEEEMTEIESLIPHLKACFKPSARIEFSPAMFRSYFGEAVYRSTIQNEYSQKTKASN